MAKEPFEQFAIPNEVRAFAEQSVAQARKAVDGFIQAANKALGQMHGRSQAAHSGATEIAQKSMAYAEQNVAATFDFAQKLTHAKDAAEVMGLQSEFLGGRCRPSQLRSRSSDKVPPNSSWRLPNLSRKLRPTSLKEKYFQ